MVCATADGSTAATRPLRPEPGGLLRALRPPADRQRLLLMRLAGMRRPTAVVGHQVPGPGENGEGKASRDVQDAGFRV